MSQRSFNFTTFDPTQFADTIDLTDGLFMAIQGGATERNIISEIWIGGQATASAVKIMVFARDSTVATGSLTLTAGAKDAVMDGSAATGTIRGFTIAATTQPQRSSTLGLLNLSFNAFGGIARWQAPQGKEISTYGAAASMGEASLSGFTGTAAGALGAHIIYETI